MKIHIQQNVLLVFNKFIQKENSNPEACGILIGNHSQDGNKITIKYATSPDKRDLRKRRRYKMLSNSHQNFLNKMFKDSKNEDIYLGTWHTHPENNPSPSFVDIEDWHKQYRANKHLFDKMIFIIVGLKKTNIWIIQDGLLSEINERVVIYD